MTLTKHNPAHIYFTGRSAENANAVIAQVGADNATFIQCDHASLKSVQAAANRLTALTQRLDVLVCNAGVMAIPPALTEDGYEIQFGINHLSHSILIKVLLPLLEKTSQTYGEARIISIASLAAEHTPSGGIAFDQLRTPQDNLGITAKWMRYGQSKLANILYAAELARRYPWLITAALEPGTVWTGLLTNLGLLDRISLTFATWWKTIELHEGAYNTCWAATAKKGEIESGGFYKPVGVRVTGLGRSEDEELARKLWDWTEDQLKDFY